MSLSRPRTIAHLEKQRRKSQLELRASDAAAADAIALGRLLGIVRRGDNGIARETGALHGARQTDANYVGRRRNRVRIFASISPARRRSRSALRTTTALRAFSRSTLIDAGQSVRAPCSVSGSAGSPTPRSRPKAAMSTVQRSSFSLRRRTPR